MAQQEKQHKRLISAAIDFGTTFSSWAYSFRHSFESDPTDVSSKNWNDGSHISSKAPTTVLIRPDGRTLEAFGYDAESKYAELIEDKKHTQYYFFKQFKMVLYDQMSINSDIKIRDSLNKPLPALTVFSLAIEYLKNDLLSTIYNRIDGEVTEKDITWVLTVPAIWTDSARMFMRKAAEQAGIRAENLKLALEPEVASLFCQNMRIKPQTKMQEAAKEELLKLAPGTKYMVLDAGDKKRIVPPDASLAVLKGAVIFGHDDKGITSRISKYTYGISSRNSFDPKVHPQSKRYVQSDGREMVRNVFSVLVHAGEKVVPGEPCQPQAFVPSHDGDTSFTLKLFASPRADPQYVDEPDCIQIGEVMVDCRDRYSRVGGAAVSLMFGGTEIQVSAVNELTKEITEAKFTTI